MDGNFGIPLLNYHKVTKTLDANKQCSTESLMETMCSVLSTDGKLIEYTILNSQTDVDVATVTEEGYIEGSEVDIILWCLRPSEMGGPCQPIIVQSDEDILGTL